MSAPRSVSRLSTLLLGAAGASFLFGMSVTVIDVVLRAVAGMNLPAAIELTSLSIGLGALLSIPVCYAQRGHVTARLLSELAPQRFGTPLGLFGAALSAVFAGLLLWVVGDNALANIDSPQTTADLGLPMPIALCTAALALMAAAGAAAMRLLRDLRKLGAGL